MQYDVASQPYRGVASQRIRSRGFSHSRAMGDWELRAPQRLIDTCSLCRRDNPEIEALVEAISEEKAAYWPVLPK